jgi:hypothetical protein
MLVAVSVAVDDGGGWVSGWVMVVVYRMIIIV